MGTSTHRLENAAMAVDVTPAYGARVVGLRDRLTGRDWIAPGGESAEIGEDAVYLADEAVGWDECFPTVAPWDASGTAWGRRLRDHGDLWGRPWTVDVADPTRLTTSLATPQFRFARALELEGPTLRARYTVENLADAMLPFMWALHGLLAVTPADRIELPGVTDATATYVSHRGTTLAVPRLGWPGPSAALPLALDRVHPAGEQFAGKLYVDSPAGGVASVGSAGAWLDLAWDSDEIAHAGLWFNYGGWPQPGGVHHLAIEPTTAPVDHLGDAIASGTAIQLAAGASRSWTVSLTLRHDAGSPAPRL